MEYNVIKIIDGLLISNATTLEDQQFMVNNKISHLLCWVHAHLRDTYMQSQPASLKSVWVVKNHDIQTSIQLIQESKDEMLCCLICCEDISHALSFVVPYLVCRFGWAIHTALCFIQRRLDNLQITNFEKQLRLLEDQLPRVLAPIICNNSHKLKMIQWSSSFLDSYSTDDIEQQVIINTVKNTISLSYNVLPDANKRKNKKKKRIQWFDDIAKNSIAPTQRLFANSRINTSLKKGSCLKNYQYQTGLKLTNSEQFVGKELNKTTKQAKTKQDSSKKIANSTKQSEIEDFQYLSLKQMSRTNFDDIKFRSSAMQKRRNLKVFRRENKSKAEAKYETFLKPLKKICDQSVGLTVMKGTKPLSIQYR